ncbi:hypothetical protein FAIPA1_180016 [Frankia sp. AiPs1]|nr:hypothetical protein [Frankia sp. AiPa1]
MRIRAQAPTIPDVPVQADNVRAHLCPVGPDTRPPDRAAPKESCP